MISVFFKWYKAIQAFKGLWKTRFQWESVPVPKSLEVLIQHGGLFVCLFTLMVYFIHFDKTVFSANWLRAGYTLKKRKSLCDKMHGRNPTAPVKINPPTQKKKNLPIDTKILKKEKFQCTAPFECTAETTAIASVSRVLLKGSPHVYNKAKKRELAGLMIMCSTKHFKANCQIS